jgi:hypothetical protein
VGLELEELDLDLVVGLELEPTSTSYRPVPYEREAITFGFLTFIDRAGATGTTVATHDVPQACHLREHLAHSFTENVHVGGIQRISCCDLCHTLWSHHEVVVIVDQVIVNQIDCGFSKGNNRCERIW